MSLSLCPVTEVHTSTDLTQCVNNDNVMLKIMILIIIMMMVLLMIIGKATPITLMH